MSKIEIVRALSDSGPQLQIVESVRTLQQAVSAMSQDLERLPSAISAETAQALEPLARLRQDVQRALESYDKITAAQRQALDEMTQALSTHASKAFEQRAGMLGASIQAMQASTEKVKIELAGIERTMGKVAALPGKLATAGQDMMQASERLSAAAERVRPSIWWRALALILAGAVGGMLAGTGQAGFAWLVPPSEVQASAQTAVMLWERATPRERELLRQIVNRPAP